MKNILVSILLAACLTLAGQKPVTMGASPEAVQLLEYIYSISGRYCLSGQHCAPLVGSTRLAVAHRVNGYYPALSSRSCGMLCLPTRMNRSLSPNQSRVT